MNMSICGSICTKAAPGVHPGDDVYADTLRSRHMRHGAPAPYSTGKRGGGPADAFLEDLELRQRACECRNHV